MSHIQKYIYTLLLLIGCISTQANPITPQQIPPALKDWQEWVLYEKPEQACPFLYNEASARYCTWPTQLSLDIQVGRIYFTQQWQVFALSRVALPGEAHFWPQNVQVNGQYAPVVDNDGTPVIELAPGTYQVEGFIPYKGELPESIQIPAHTALVKLSNDQIAVNHPRLDDTGRLWLHHQENNQMNAALQMRVFRKVTQAVPMEVLTFIELDVSGPAREVQLGPVLLPETVATRIDSSMPAQLDDNGLLRVQLRPGKWQIEVNSRYVTDVDTLKRAEVGPPWPAEEIWSFVFDPRLGMMNISGVPNVDPNQTLLPEDWRALPAYRVLVADPVLLTHANTAKTMGNQLTLTRQMWLDFSGQLWTVQDQLQGQMHSLWRLSLPQPFMLGRFSLDNQEQLITVLEDNQGEMIPGVEVRKGFLSASATSLVDSLWRLPVAGWNETFNAVNTTLYLPPGWQLITAIGVDQVSGTLLSQWSLFDVFIVLVIVLALTTILGAKWGLLAFVMMLLTYHQAHAPLWIWLNLTLVLWLLQWLQKTRGRFLLSIYRDISFAVLALMIVWLSSSSLVNSLYPQLKSIDKAPVVLSESALMEARPMMMEKKLAADPFAVPLDAKTQTGPAQPQWQWTQVQLDWRTSVMSSQYVYLFLQSPLVDRLLSVLQIILLLSVGLRLWKMRSKPLQLHLPFKRSAVMIVPLCVLILSSVVTSVQASEIPDPELLETLKTRLLATDDCLPDCASISQMAIDIRNDELHLMLQVDALSHVAVPIPGRAAYWQAQQVLVDNVPATGLFWQDNTLMVQVDKGMHTVAVQGTVADIDKLSLAFALIPHRLDVQAEGWFTEGVNNYQLFGNTLHLSRRERSLNQDGMVATIAPFARVVRSLSLGLNANVTTTVERVAPMTGSMQLSIPLLPHETVVSENIPVQNNRAQVYLAPDEREVVWQSTLSNFNDLTLMAPQTNEWVEEWRVQISPMWHPTITGIPALYESSYDIWQSTWQPWPLQSVHIQLIRPQAMSGQTVTIDQVNVLTDANARGRDVSVQALLRSTLGDQHKLILPSNAQLQSVHVNGVLQVVGSGPDVLLPLGPGDNWVDINWQTNEAPGLLTRTPELNWGMPAYNINLGLNMPSDRFVIALGGAGYGPALLYWIWVISAIIVAVILGKMIKSPLRIADWLLLSIGLSLITPFLGLWVIVAIVLLSMREKFIKPLDKRMSLGVQVLLCLFITLAGVILVYAITQGLRGIPDMQLRASALVANLSAQYVWLQDLSMQTWPRAFVISLPLWVYRALILIWSLWIILLALRLVPWIWQVLAKRG